jgi:hypothetical protein
VSDGGSSILYYTLALVRENVEDEVVYFGEQTFVYLDNLTPGHSYTYHVKSTSMVGDSQFSDKYTFLMVDTPSEPLQLELLEFTDNYVSFMWRQPMFNGG